MLNRSLHFLQHTEDYLDWWMELGHDTCHRTEGYDAEACHQDCRRLETGAFAQTCRRGGGLYKCCIR